MKLKSYTAVFLAATFAGCGGTATPLPAGGGGTNAQASERAERAPVRMRIVIPRRRRGRRERYISPSTRSMAIVIVSSKGATINHNVDLTPATNPACTAGGCTIAFSVPAGQYTFSLAAFDGLLNSDGQTTGHELSAHFSVPVTIRQGHLNSIGVTLDGIATSVTLVPSPNSALAGSGTAYALSKCYGVSASQRTQSVNVIGVDADKNYILAAGAPSASLTTDDGVHLAVTEAAPTIPQTFLLTDPTGVLPVPRSAVHLTATVTPAADSHAAAVSAVFTVTFDAAICGVFTTFPLPSPNSYPVGITVGSDGAMWFAEENANQIGRITTSGAITEYPTSGFPYGIAAGPQNTIWFTQCGSNQVGEIATSGGTVYESHIPTSTAGLYNIASDPHGAYPWFTESSANNVDTLRNTGLGIAIVREYAVTTSSSRPWGITAGPDGAMWFTEQSGNAIGRFSAGVVTNEFPIPTSGSGPDQIAPGADGNLWFTEGLTSKIGRITTSGSITEYSVPTSSRLEGIAAGPDGAMYFVEIGAQKIGRITTSGSVTEFDVPGGGNPTIVVQGPDSAMWFTKSVGSAIVRMQ